MALSEREQHLLDEIVKGLREDPSFAAGLDPARVRRRTHRRAVAWALAGSLLLVLGEVLAMSVVLPGVVLAVCGFLMMVAAFASPVHRRDHRRSGVRLPPEGIPHHRQSE